MNNLLFFVLSLSLCLASCAASDAAAPTQVQIVLPSPGPTEPTCSSFELQPTPEPDAASRFPPVSADDHMRGGEQAVVTLVVYDDFQCQDCNYLPLSQTLLERHPEELRIVYRPYPYSAYFDKAELAARAAEAAGEQGQFWEMHDLLFARQAEWTELTPAAFQTWLARRAAELELDVARFQSDLESEQIIARVQAEAQSAADLGIYELPFFLRNGQVYTGPKETYSLDRDISLTALGKRQISACPPVVIDPSKQYLATLYTEHGQVEVQLFADKAPLAVNSFVYLAQSGWYDDITFHNVVPEYVAQTGDPSGTGLGNPGYLFKTELDASLKFDQPGRLAIFNTGPDTNGSQFFITYQAAPELNGRYTIFGQVLSGMEVLSELTPRQEQTGKLLPPGDRLLRVSIEEK